MPLTRNQKEEVVAAVRDALASPSTVFVHFNGLSVADANTMRRALRAQGVSYRVAKKSLVHRALDESEVTGERPQLDGELAIAWGEDFVAPAREISRFEREFDGAVSIMGGIFDSAYKDATEMGAIAAIPSLQTLYGQFANVINSPIQGLVVALGAVAKQREATA